MSRLIGAVILGFILARWRVLPQAIANQMGRISTFALILLLFSMGISIGANSEIISNLPSLGLKAFILSCCTVLGSVFFVWLAVKITTKQQGGCQE